MKKFIFLCIVLFTAATVLAQKPKPVLVDEFGEVCSEDLMARMDNFFIELNKDSTSQEIVTFHGREDMEGRNVKLWRYISDIYPQLRIRDLSRLTFIRGENRHQQLIQFWISPPGVEKTQIMLYAPQRHYPEPRLFDRAWVDIHRWYGQTDIYSDGFLDLGCDFSPNRELFAKILRENKHLNAFLIVYTKKSDRKLGRKIATFALIDLVGNYKVPRSAIRAIYGGTRKEPEVEFWLVPKGKEVAKARPNVAPIRDF